MSILFAIDFIENPKKFNTIIAINKQDLFNGQNHYKIDKDNNYNNNNINHTSININHNHRSKHYIMQPQWRGYSH